MRRTRKAMGSRGIWSIFMAPLTVMMVILAAADGREYLVGGKDGWSSSPRHPFNQWAQKLSLQTSYTPMFKHKVGEDSLLSANSADYHPSNTKNPIESYGDGTSVVELDQHGHLFFISRTPGRSEKGQKLAVVVLPERNSPEPSLPVPAFSPTQAPAEPHPPAGQPPRARHHSPTAAPTEPPAGSSPPSQAPASAPTQAPAASPHSPVRAPAAAPQSPGHGRTPGPAPSRAPTAPRSPSPAPSCRPTVAPARPPSAPHPPSRHAPSEGPAADPTEPPRPCRYDAPFLPGLPVNDCLPSEPRPPPIDQVQLRPAPEPSSPSLHTPNVKSAASAAALPSIIAALIPIAVMMGWLMVVF